MFLSFLLYLVSAETIILDIGTSMTKGGRSKADFKVILLQNIDGRLAVPSFISLKYPKSAVLQEHLNLSQKEAEKTLIMLGNRAISKISSNNSYGAGFIPYFINADMEKVKKFIHFLPFNHTIYGFTYEETLSLYLHSYLRRVSNPYQQQRVAFVIPRFFTQKQKNILRSALELTDYLFAGFVYDDDAVLNTFAYISKHGDTKPIQTSLIIDVGATSIRAYAARVYHEAIPKRVEKISYEYSLSEGGYFVTQRMMEHFMNKYNLHNMTYQQKARLYQGCEVMKIQFSKTNMKHIEYVLENNGECQDIHLNMTFEEYAQVVQPLIDETVKVARKATQSLENFSVAFLGGSSEIPGLKANVSDEIGGILLDLNRFSDLYIIGGGYMQQGIEGYRLAVTLNFTEADNFNQRNLSIIETGTDNEVFLCRAGEKCLDSVIFNTSTKSITIRESFPIKSQIQKNDDYVYNFDGESIRITVINSSICKAEILNKNNTWETVDLYNNLPRPELNGTMKRMMHHSFDHISATLARDRLEHYISTVETQIQTPEFKNMAPEKFINGIRQMLDKTNKWIWTHADQQSDDTEFYYLLSELSNITNPEFYNLQYAKKVNEIETYINVIYNFQKIESTYMRFNKSTAYKQKIFNIMMNETARLFDIAQVLNKHIYRIEDKHRPTSKVLEAAAKVYSLSLDESHLFDLEPTRSRQIREKIRNFILRKDDRIIENLKKIKATVDETEEYIYKVTQHKQKNRNNYY